MLKYMIYILKLNFIMSNDSVSFNLHTHTHTFIYYCRPIKSSAQSLNCKRKAHLNLSDLFICRTLNHLLSCRLSNILETIVYLTYFGDQFGTSNQRLTTRGRPVTKRYASLIAITRFHVAIKRAYARLFPCTNNNALHGSIVARHLLCESRTLKRRDGYRALTQNSHDRSFIFFSIPFYDDSKIRKIYIGMIYILLNNIKWFWFFLPSCDMIRYQFEILTNRLVRLEWLPTG